MRRWSQASHASGSRRARTWRQACTSASWTASCARSRVAEDEPGDAMQSGIRRSHQDGERVVVPCLRPFYELTLHVTTAPAWLAGPRSTFTSPAAARTVPVKGQDSCTPVPTRMLLALVDGDHQTPRHIAHIRTGGSGRAARPSGRVSDAHHGQIRPLRHRAISTEEGAAQRLAPSFSVLSPSTVPPAPSR